MDHVDCVVAGAGVVGLAIARELARGGRQVLCLDAGAALGSGTSGRGSGVIHAGLYYPPGSLKARLCVAGKELLYAFAELHGVPCIRRGKLVVATSSSEDEYLDRIAACAADNSVADLRRIGGEEARLLEPALRCTSALFSPSTGVIDARALLEALRAEAEEYGSVTAFEAPVERGWVEDRGFTLEIGGAAPMRISCRQFVNAAGHGAPADLGEVAIGAVAVAAMRHEQEMAEFVRDREAPPLRVQARRAEDDARALVDVGQQSAGDAVGGVIADLGDADALRERLDRHRRLHSG